MLAVAQAGDNAYAYVSPPGATARPAAPIVKIDATTASSSGGSALPEAVAASAAPRPSGPTAMSVVVAGGERIGVLDADDGDCCWTQSVVTLGKSRGYALPGAVQQVIVTDSLVFLSATPDG